jgi:hypothetical protein
MNRFLPAAELRRPDVAGIPDLPSLPVIFNDQCNADEESDDSLDLGRAEGVSPNQLVANRILRKAICQKDGAA